MHNNKKPKNESHTMSDKIHRDHESRITRLEVTIENINQTLIRLEKKMDDGFDRLDKKIDSKFDFLDKKFDTKFDILDKKIDSNFKWIIGLYIGGFGSLIFSIVGLIFAHALKWV